MTTPIIMFAHSDRLDRRLRSRKFFFEVQNIVDKRTTDNWFTSSVKA